MERNVDDIENRNESVKGRSKREIISSQVGLKISSQASNTRDYFHLDSLQSNQQTTCLIC